MNDQIVIVEVTEAEDIPSDVSLQDFSSGNEDNYVPDYNDFDTSDIGNVASDNESRPNSDDDP